MRAHGIMPRREQLEPREAAELRLQSRGQLTAVRGDALNPDLFLQAHGRRHANDEADVARAVFVARGCVGVFDQAGRRDERELAGTGTYAGGGHGLEPGVADVENWSRADRQATCDR